MCKVIAIANQKGGTGKTSTTVNLGIALANKGKKVLLIDLDSQGSLTISLGIDEPDKLEWTICNTMQRIIEERFFRVKDGLITHKEGVDFIPGNIELAAMDVFLVNVLCKEKILKEYIDRAREDYDYILIDCMPSLGMLTINALAASDSVLIPVQPAYLSAKGLQQLLQTVIKVKRKINSNLEIEGILFTMVDDRTNFAKDNMEIIYKTYGENVYIYENKIPFSVRAAETSALGKSIFTHERDGRVAQSYEGLCEEVLFHE